MWRIIPWLRVVRLRNREKRSTTSADAEGQRDERRVRANDRNEDSTSGPFDQEDVFVENITTALKCAVLYSFLLGDAILRIVFSNTFCHSTGTSPLVQLLCCWGASGGLCSCYIHVVVRLRTERTIKHTLSSRREEILNHGLSC